MSGVADTTLGLSAAGARDRRAALTLLSAAAVRAVVRQGCLGPNQAKALLRAGMGPCQGRVCGPAVAFLHGWPTDSVSIRPPIFPVAVGSLAG